MRYCRLARALPSLLIGQADESLQVADADGAGMLAEDVEDLEPRWVGQCLEQVGRGDRLFVREVSADHRLAAWLPRTALRFDADCIGCCHRFAFLVRV